MPGFLGGSSAGASGTGGEIQFPKEFIDPVTKLRVSQPENLIDTDFEYGLQPTKWETVELINNTPSFFSKSGDTTIPNIQSIITNAGTREIIVTTALDHGLDVGIPINVQGSKSVTADGSYIINSIPNTKTFTYLARDVQPETSSIEDLYTSIITGEFFQGSQLRLSESEGIVTDASSLSSLTITTASPHGFGTGTPFYFLNLNSTISQEFAAANTETKSFDSSNSATAQTFDGSNTLSSINIDWSNSANVAGIASTVDFASIANDTITITHGVQNFVGLETGAPLYYDVTAAGGYFLTNPRGVVFLGVNSTLGVASSVIQVTRVPNGDPIVIDSNLSGFFKLANQARTFAGNNVNPNTEVVLDIVQGPTFEFDGANDQGITATIDGFSGSNITVQSSEELTWYQNAMVRYDTTGGAATNLVDERTYFVDSFFRQGTSDLYSLTLKELPDTAVIGSISGGTGTQTITQIGVAIDKDILHIKDNDFNLYDMLEYKYPEGGRFSAQSVDEEVNFYYVSSKLDTHNVQVNQTTGDLLPKTVSRINIDRGQTIVPTEVTPVGLTEPITYAVTSGALPNGLTLNTSTGVVSGTPVEVIDAPGREVTITATDAEGITAFQIHTYQINPTVGEVNPSTLVITGEVGTAINTATPTTTNLVAPIVWDVSSGTLPGGISLNTSTGRVTGTPTEEIAAPGRQVVIRATDTGGLQAFQTQTYQIDPQPITWEIIMRTNSRKGTSGRQDIFANAGSSGFRNASLNSTGAANRTTFGNGIGVYRAFFEKTDITRVAFVDGSSSSLDPTQHNNYLIYNLTESTGNESFYDILRRLDIYQQNAGRFQNNDSVWGSPSVRNHSAGSNGYSGLLNARNTRNFDANNGNIPNRFVVMGINRDSDNDIQALCAFSGDLQRGKGDSWRGNNPSQTFWSYWGDDFHSNSSTQRIGNQNQTNPGVANGARWSGNVYMMAF